MATPKQLVQKVASLTGIAVNTVIQHDRNLADAGLRTIAGRGRAAARVTALDAAHLLIAVAGSRNVKDSSLVVAELGRLVARQTLEVDGKAAGGTFAEALAVFITVVPEDVDSLTGAARGFVRVSLYGPDPRAEIEYQALGGGGILEFHPAKSKRAKDSAEPDLEFVARFTQQTLTSIGILVAQ